MSMEYTLSGIDARKMLIELRHSSPHVVEAGTRSAVRRARAMRVSDWIKEVILMNRSYAGLYGGVRSRTAILGEGSSWMHWHSPADNLELRLRDVISAIVSPRVDQTSLFATFPLMILLHPFEDANRRTALDFVRALNDHYQIVESDLISTFVRTLNDRRLRVISSISEARISQSLLPFRREFESDLNGWVSG